MRRYFKIFLILPILGCAEEEFRDTIPPSVIGTEPKLGSTSLDPLNPTIGVYLSEPVEIASISFTLRDISGQVEVELPMYQSGSTKVYLNPAARELVPDNTYIASFIAKDEAGNVMRNFMWSFSTGPALEEQLSLKIKDIRPAGTKVQEDAIIEIEFDGFVEPLLINLDTVKLISHSPEGDEPVDLDFGWDPSSGTLIADPAPALASQRYYTIHVTDILDISLKPVLDPRTSSFRIRDFTSPSIVQMHPPSRSSGCYNMNIEVTEVWVEFSEEMDADTINSFTFVVKRFDESLGFIKVEGDVEYKDDERRAYFYPDSITLDGGVYIVMVFSDMADKSGNELVNPYNWCFTAP